MGSNANGISIAGEHAPTLSLWDTSSSGFHSHLSQVGSDLTLRSSGTLSIQVAGGTRAMRLDSDKSVTFDSSIHVGGNAQVSGALYTDSINRKTTGSEIKINSGLNLSGNATLGNYVYFNSYGTATWDGARGDFKIYGNSGKNLKLGANGSENGILIDTSNNTTISGVLTTNSNIVAGSHLITTNRLYLDGGSDTYIEESSANTVDINNGVLSARFETGRTLFYLPFQPQSDVQLQDWKLFKQGSYHHSVTTPVFDPRNVGGTGKARWEIARIFIDRVNWNTTGMTKVKVYERYWYAGAWKEYEINFGYSNANQGVCKLVDCGGFGTTQAEFMVSIGVPTQIPNGTANKYYIPIYLRSKSYVQIQAHITSTHNYASDWNNSHYGIAYALNNTNLDAKEDSFTVNVDALKITPYSTSGVASEVYFDNTWVTASANMKVQ